MRKDELGAYSLETLRSLPRPNIYERDPEAIKARMISYFEEATGRKLYDGQVEMYLIETWAYGFTLAMEEAQGQAEQYLVAYSQGGGLDALGANRGVKRLEEAYARAQLRFTAAVPFDRPMLIPAGRMVRAEDSSLWFITERDTLIPAGESDGGVTPAYALEAGTWGNNFAKGSLNVMGLPIAGISVSNVTVSEGGADRESDDAYRLRLANAPELISQAGPAAGYRERVFAVSPAIVDCAVFRPQPCYIDIYALTADGTAGAELKAQIEAALNPEHGRPMGDEVSIKDCEGVGLSGEVVLRAAGGGLPDIAEEAQRNIDKLIAVWRQSLAAIIAPSDIIEAVKHISGVLDAAVSGIVYQKLGAAQYVLGADIKVTVEAVDG